MKIEAEFDLEGFKNALESTKTIKGDEEFFTKLGAIDVLKSQLKTVSDELISLETEAKGLIDARAKALYGDNWQVIDGERVKIVKSPIGSVYDIADTTSAKFVVVKKSANTKAIEDFVVKNSKLPKGVELNPDRGWSMRIKVK